MNKLYPILLMACLAGYAWVYVSATKSKPIEVCLIKRATNMPCPSCGATRSVVSLAKGHFAEALNINPIGYLAAAAMLVAPIWILADTIMRSNTLIGAYQTMEARLRKPKYAAPLVLLVVINWVWNIAKGL